MQHKKITGENSEIMRTIILPSQFLEDLNKITQMTTSIRNVKGIAELNRIIEAAELNGINYEDQDKPIEDQTQATPNIDEETQVTSPTNMEGGTNIIGKISNPDGYQPYYTSLLLTYTDYQIKNDLNRLNPSIFPFESLQDMSFETIAMRMCGQYCGKMMMNGKLIHTTEEQKKLYFERLQNLQLRFALKYEENAEMINFQKPGFEKLLVDPLITQNEIAAKFGDSENKYRIIRENLYNPTNSLKSLKNFAYVNDDTFIFNQGKRLAQYIAFAGETEEDDVNRQGKRQKGRDGIMVENEVQMVAANEKVSSALSQEALDSNSRKRTRPSGGKRKTKKKLIRKLIKGKKSLKEKKLIKEKKSLKRKKLSKQKKSLKVKKLNKVKKTIKNKSKS